MPTYNSDPRPINPLHRRCSTVVWAETPPGASTLSALLLQGSMRGACVSYDRHRAWQAALCTWAAKVRGKLSWLDKYWPVGSVFRTCRCVCGARGRDGGLASGVEHFPAPQRGHKPSSDPGESYCMPRYNSRLHWSLHFRLVRDVGEWQPRQDGKRQSVLTSCHGLSPMALPFSNWLWGTRDSPEEMLSDLAIHRDCVHRLLHPQPCGFRGTAFLSGSDR